jgi:hypothetical protein
MFNKDKKSVLGYNGLLPDILEESIPLFIPDELGPWAIRYLWIKKDQDDNFLENYHSNHDGIKSNVRKSSVNLEKYWIPHNALIINQGHLGNIVWRIKINNPFNNSVDVIEVWRSKEIIKNLFDFEKEDSVTIEQAIIANPFVTEAKSDITNGGTGLKNGSGLTINDSDAPRFFTKTDSCNLTKGLIELGFKIRSWEELPTISKKQAIEIYKELESRSKKNDKIKINTGWNPELNPL